MDNNKVVPESLAARKPDSNHKGPSQQVRVGSRVARTTLARVIQTLKVTIVVLSTAVLTWQIKVCLQRYLKFETTATLSVKPTGETTFLAFSVCPAFESAYKDDILRKYGSSRFSYNSGYYGVNVTEKSAAEIYEEVTYQLDEILKGLHLVTLSKNRYLVNISVVQTDLDREIGHWRLKHHTLFGKCYSLELSDSITSLGVIELAFESFINIYVFLHHPGQFLDYNSMTKAHGVVGTVTFLDIAYSHTINTLENDADMPCSSDMNRLFDDCMLIKGPETVMRHVGCTVPYVPNPYPTCDPNNQTLLGEVLRVYEDNARTGQKDMCQKPCHTIEILTGLPFNGDSIVNEETGQLTIYLKSTTKLSKMVLDYPWVTMLAEIGGYTGLILGISLVNITKVIAKMSQKFLEK